MLEKNYIQSLKDLINNGIKSTDRTGIGTLRLINAPILNIKENIIPILKGKFISPYNSFTELEQKNNDKDISDFMEKYKIGEGE